MPKYRLKNKELHRKLDEFSDGAFSKNLHPFDDEHFSAGWGKPIFIAGYSVDENANEKNEEQELKRFLFPQFGCFFNNNEVEEVPEYDPHAWNNYPDVTPPEGVLMRIETKGGRKFCGYYHTFAEGGCWCYEDGTVCPEAISKSVGRFRPWED